MEENFIDKIRNGELDVNNKSNFFSNIIKGFLFDINNNIELRGEKIPHIILNSGDDILYLENKGYDFKKEPLDNTNEDYIINKTPRAIVTIGGVNLLGDQTTSPYSIGNFEYEYNDIIYSLSAEVRRIALSISVTVKYFLDSYLDALDVMQYIISKFGFQRTYKVTYMGKEIISSYKIPESLEAQKNIEFDGGSYDSKYKTIEISFDIETNIPVFKNRTVMDNNKIITQIQHQMILPDEEKIIIKNI